MLVLLIVFMVTAPMITSGVNVNLPQANAKPVNSDAKPITITVNAQDQIYLQNSQVQLAKWSPHCSRSPRTIPTSGYSCAAIRM